jgi:phage gpG-like protein
MASPASLRSALGAGSSYEYPEIPRKPFGGFLRGVGLFTGRSIDMGFSVEFTPTVAMLMRDFDNLGADIRSYKEPLTRAIQQVMAPSFQKNFDVGGRPKWPPLSEVTKQIRRRQGLGDQVLVRSGKLRAVAGQLNIWHIDGQNGRAYVQRLPSRAWYGQIHQGGTHRVGFMSFMMGNTPGLFAAQGEIPPRPFIVAQREDLDNVQKVFAQWIDERIKAQMGSRGPGSFRR